MSLRELDDRLVPGLARRTRAAADKVVAVRRRAGALTARLRSPRRRSQEEGPSGPAPAIVRLRDLDDRLARSGPLALLREVPQLGALAIAVLILVSGATVAQRSEPRSGTSADGPDSEATRTPLPSGGEGGEIGPQIGDPVGDYLDRADRRLQDRLVADPDERSFAVISLASYLTPVQLAQLLGDDVGGFRVFFKVPADGIPTEVEETAVKRLVPDTLAAFDRVATQRRADIGPLLEMADTTDDPQFKAFFQMTAKAYQLEIDRLSKGCACVFGVVTIATNARLSALRRTAAVRLVDVGPAGATLEGLTFRALLPEETVTVTGGNQAPA